MEIPRDLADAEQVPDDLDSNLVGPYNFPSPRRRRIAAVIYLAAAGAAAVGGILTAGLWVMAAALVGLAAYHWMTAWDLVVDQHQALDVAARSVAWEIGHASAAVRFVGLKARPVWYVIVYEAGEPPLHRALVQVDAGTAHVNGVPYLEDIPSA